MSFGNLIGKNLYAAGQPSQAEFRRLAASGFRRIIDLRPTSEDHGFDEPGEAAVQGLEYLHLPIAGEAELIAAKVRQLDTWLNDGSQPKTLVHCGSSNRVGALIALRAAWFHGMSADAALAEGRSAGLKAMEPAVRMILAQHTTPTLP